MTIELPFLTDDEVSLLVRDGVSGIVELISRMYGITLSTLYLKVVFLVNFVKRGQRGHDAKGYLDAPYKC